jgi:hypothetical protein
MDTAFRAYSTQPVLVFEQRFPDAIKGAASGSDASTTSTAFPSWIMDDAAGLQGFAGKGQGATNGPWGSADFQVRKTPNLFYDAILY